MFMSKKMILTVFVIAVAFGTEAELQVIPVLLCPAAYGAFMLCHTRCHFGMDCLLELLPPVYFFRIDMAVIPGGKKEHDKVQQGRDDHHPDGPDRCLYKIIDQVCNIQIRQPFDLHRNHKVQKKLHIRVTGCKSQENGQVDIICGDRCHSVKGIHGSLNKIEQKCTDDSA